MTTQYTIQDHKHRFSAWAAGRAASVKDNRFTVQMAEAILTRAKLHHLLIGPDALPEPHHIDPTHRNWRMDVIAAAAAVGHRGEFTHGVAAKLINVYLKAAFVCGGFETDPRVEALHPPIDELLLKQCHCDDVGELKVEWGRFRKLRWSKLGSDDYEAVIACIRQSLGEGVPLWKIEEHWRGYQQARPIA